uniref:Uncharacterized protein n=1 Tax=Arundo donax TaxID=35708 RepID=A0A0A9BJB9_ARUDO
MLSSNLWHPNRSRQVPAFLLNCQLRWILLAFKKKMDSFRTGLRVLVILFNS